jgi:hypothetical protein
MYAKDNKYFMDRDWVYDMLTKEDQYASGWGEAEGEKSNPVFPEHTINYETGDPFSLMDFIVFTEKYLNDAKAAYSNYCPDNGAVRIRLIKAASLLVTALQVHGKFEDLELLAGKSSDKTYPIRYGGLAVLQDEK